MGSFSTAAHGSGERVEMADLVFAIAEQRNVDPFELSTPLHDAIDTDALERLLRSADHRTRIAFTYEELRIELSGDGDLSISEVPDEG